MTSYILLIPILVSFFVTLLTTPSWIKRVKQIGLVWDDMNKFSSKKIAGSGGVIAILGFVVGILVFIAYRTFYLTTGDFLPQILALISVVLFVAVIGLIDDLFGWQKGGLSIKTRLVLIALASVPLIAINAGESRISLPIFGVVELGLLYPLILIPIGIIGAATTFNILAGFNGLETGQGILMMLAVGLVAFFTGSPWLTIIAFCMAAALTAFLFFNFYPAKVFPGDSLTYATGALIAGIAILGDLERIAVFFFAPYIIETGLKLRGKLKKQSFGIPKEDGTLDLRYEKMYSLTHVAIFMLNKFGFKATEKRVVYSIWGLQLLIIILVFIIFAKGIFQ